jgi:hypothetical protein
LYNYKPPKYFSIFWVPKTKFLITPKNLDFLSS